MYIIQNGKLKYIHQCEGCSRHLLKNENDECELCGYTKKEIDAKYKECKEFNIAMDFYKKFKNKY